MNKKLIISIVVVIIIAVLVLCFVYYANSQNSNEISEETFNQLVQYDINNENMIQIIIKNSLSDASDLNYYNIDLNQRSIVSLSRHSAYGIEPKTYYTKYEYTLTGEDVEYIKEQVELVKNLNEDKNILISYNTHYQIKTSEVNKTFVSHNIAMEIIDNIVKITYKDLLK